MALVGLACSFVVFQDERTLVCYGVALFTHVALFMDASAFLRRWMFRSFALASVGFWFVLLVLSLRLTPRLVPAKVPIGNSTGMDVLDLAIHCYTTIAIFFVAKMYRSRHLVPPSRTPTTRIQCHFYFPCCRLVPVDRNNDVKGVNATNSGDSMRPLRTSMADVPLPRSVTQLELANDSLPGIVDTNYSIIRLQAPNVIVRWLNMAAVVGFLCSWISLCWHIVHIQVSSTMAAQELTPSIVELEFTLWFCMIYASQANRTLFRRLISSLDAWYVSVQFTIITIGVCDAISFDRRALLVLPPWLWCHWVMILDTFSPPMKLRLGFQRWLVRLVQVALLVYPIVLVYWVFYSNAPGLRNRVLFSTTVLRSQVRMEVFSLLVSRVWTVWLWMGRFLWREVFRPVEAFKLLKFRVEYSLVS